MTTDLDGLIQHHAVIANRNKTQCSRGNLNMSYFDLQSRRAVTKQKVDREHWNIYYSYVMADGKEARLATIELLKELAEYAYRFKM